LTGFNIYRSVNGGEYILIGTSSEMTYIDPEDGLVTGSMNCYQVSSVWESPTDQCESIFSNEACALWTTIANYPDPAKDSFNIYPNPANAQAFITSLEDMKRVTIFNATGQLVFDQNTTGRQFELKTAGYTIGLYMVRVETAAGIATRKLTIRR